MCVIAIKPKGVSMPTQTWIDNMWYSNPDGAGFMYADGKNVVINKGFMKLADFNNAIADLADKVNLKETALIMHFRIGTAGGNIPANTHPFPISDSIPVLQKLTCRTKLGIVHNGIINIHPRQADISDTMEYIASQLAPLWRYDHEFYKSKDLLQMIGNATASKLAFLTPKGEIYTIGSFTEDGGMLFSNTSYYSGYWYRRVPTRAYGLTPADYDDLYDDWTYGVSHGEYVTDVQLLAEGYVIDMETGGYYSADDYDFFVDETGFLYFYDDEMQMCMEVTGDYEIFDKDGNAFKVNKDHLCGMIITPEEIMLSDLDESPFASGTDEKGSEKDPF